MLSASTMSFFFTLFTLYILHSTTIIGSELRIFPRLQNLNKLSTKLYFWWFSVGFCCLHEVGFALCEVGSRQGIGRCSHCVAYLVYVARPNTFIYRVINPKRSVLIQPLCRVKTNSRTSVKQKIQLSVEELVGNFAL